MSQPAQQIAERYRLQLRDPWPAWFDDEWSQIPLAGSFRAALASERLMAEAPQEIWPGFMLPDTLPLVSNDYGDWICVRVEADDSFGELLHWYHGGGDWIPVGRHLAEMVVHDAIDQFRPVTRQMLRGAPESAQARPRSQVLIDICNPRLQRWLVERLPVERLLDGLGTSSNGQCGSMSSTDASMAAINRQRIDALTDLLAGGDYRGGLESLRRWRWAEDAVACDLIQFALQHPLDPLADSSIARQLNMSWTPDYVRLLFDLSRVSPEVREQMLAIASEPGAADDPVEDGQRAPQSSNHWPEQNWQLAGQVAEEVLQRRSNLGWAVNIAGWSHQRRGDFQTAANIYYAGRLASSYSDQAVRMRSHWNDPRYGKFTLAQLFSLRDYLTSQQQNDGYLLAIEGAPAQSTTAAVQQFWMATAERQLSDNSPAEAYRSYYLAGWDLGVQRLAEYRRILQGLSRSAQAAGWQARAAVAETHLACLNRRLP